MGASNHAIGGRQNEDYYATDPKAVELLLKEETFSRNILEPACGTGHISKVLKKHNKVVVSSDLIDRGYGIQSDFFKRKHWNGDIITNPPYKDALKFVKHALDIIPMYSKVAMLLRLQFLEGKTRRKFFEENPPITIYVCSGRIKCAKNGDFEKYPSSAIAFAWFVWEKGYQEKPRIEWIN